MEEPTDSLQLPFRIDDSELGYAARYPPAVGLNDADEPVAYKNRYSSVYSLYAPINDPSNKALESTMADGTSTRVRDDSSSGPPAFLPESQTVAQGGRDGSDDEVPFHRVAAYTRSASKSARDGTAIAAAAAARTATLSQRLSYAESGGEALELLDQGNPGVATVDPHPPSTEPNCRPPDSAMNPANVAVPTAAANMPPGSSGVDNSNQEGTAAALLCAAQSDLKLPSLASILHKPQLDPDADLSQLQPATVETSSSLTLSNNAACDPPQSVQVPYGANVSDINPEALPQQAPYHPPADIATMQASLPPAAASARDSVGTPYPPNPTQDYPAVDLLDTASEQSAQWTAVDVAPPAGGIVPPQAPATWHESEARCCFEDVPLGLVTVSNSDPPAAGLDLLRQSATGSVLGAVEPPLEAHEVVATVEHPVFDDPDLLESAEVHHLGPQPSPGAAEGNGSDGDRAAAATAAVVAAAGPLDGGSAGPVISQQLLDDYRIAAAAGLVSPELAMLLGLAPPPEAEGFRSAERERKEQEGEEEEEVVEEREAQLGFAQADGNGMGDLAPAVQQQQQQQDLTPLAYVLDSRQAVADIGTESGSGVLAIPSSAAVNLPSSATALGSHHPLPVAAVQRTASGLSGAARVQRAAVGDPFDAADTDDDELAVTSAVPAAFAAAPQPPLQAVPGPLQPGAGQTYGEASTGPATAAVAAAVAGLAVATAAGAALGTVAVASQRMGPQQLWQGPTGHSVLGATQLGPHQQHQQQPFPPPPYTGPPALVGRQFPPGFQVPTRMRTSAPQGTAPGPQPGLTQQQQHSGPPSPRVKPAPGVGPQSSFPARSGPAGVQSPPGGAPSPGAPAPAAATAAVGVPPQARGVGPWTQGVPVPVPYGAGPMPSSRPGLQPPPQPLPGIMPGAPRPPVQPRAPPGHVPIPGGPPSYPPGPPGMAVRPGMRPPQLGPGGPMLGSGRGDPMPGPGPAGAPGALRPPPAPGGFGPRPSPPPPSPYPGLLYTEGRDTLGRPVVVLNTAMLPVKAKKNDVLQYVLQQLQPVVQQDYVIVVLSLALGVKAGSVSSTWALGAYRSLAKPYRKNVKHVVLVQPSAWARTLLALAQPFVSKKAAHKVKKVDNLVQISEVTAGEVKLESLGARFIREIQYGLGAPPLVGLTPGPAPGPGRPAGPQRPPLYMGPLPRGPPMPGVSPTQPAPPYPARPVPYGPPPGPRLLPPGSDIATPVYGPGGPGPSAPGRIHGTPPPPRPQFPPGAPVPGAVAVGVGVDPQPARDSFVAVPQPPASR